LRTGKTEGGIGNREEEIGNRNFLFVIARSSEKNEDDVAISDGPFFAKVQSAKGLKI